MTLEIHIFELFWRGGFSDHLHHVSHVLTYPKYSPNTGNNTQKSQLPGHCCQDTIKDESAKGTVKETEVNRHQGSDIFQLDLKAEHQEGKQKRISRIYNVCQSLDFEV